MGSQVKWLEVFPKMWNPASLLMWLSLWLLMFTLLGPVSYTDTDSQSNVSKTHKKSSQWPSNFRNISCWLYSNISGSRVNYRHTGALRFYSERQMSSWELPRCAPLYMWLDPFLHPSREGVWLEYQKLILYSLFFLCFLTLKWLFRYYLHPIYYILGGVKLWMLEDGHLSVWVFLQTWACQILKFMHLDTHS